MPCLHARRLASSPTSGQRTMFESLDLQRPTSARRQRPRHRCITMLYPWNALTKRINGMVRRVWTRSRSEMFRRRILNEHRTIPVVHATHKRLVVLGDWRKHMKRRSNGSMTNRKRNPVAKTMRKICSIFVLNSVRTIPYSMHFLATSPRRSIGFYTHPATFSGMSICSTDRSIRKHADASPTLS